MFSVAKPNYEQNGPDTAQFRFVAEPKMDAYPALSLNVSVNEIFRKSKDVDPELVERYIYNRAVDEPAYTILIVMYSLLIVIGALGNTLVVS